jgi:hypothetical protein
VADDRADVGLVGACAEGGDLLVGVPDRPPGARVVREDLQALAAEGDAPADRLADAPG